MTVRAWANMALTQLTTERSRIVGALHDNDPLPLAEHLATGGELFDDQREALVKYLRGDFRPKRRGNKRKIKQEQLEANIRYKVRCLQWHFAIEHGSYGSLQRAFDFFDDHDPSLKMDTLKKYVPRGLSKDELKLIDQMRSEAQAKAKAAERTVIK